MLLKIFRTIDANETTKIIPLDQSAHMCKLCVINIKSSFYFYLLSYLTELSSLKIGVKFSV